MNAKRRGLRQRWLLLPALAALAALPHRALGQPPQPGRVVPLAVSEGRCRFDLVTPTAGDKYFLVIGCLARAPGPYRVTVRTETVARPEPLPEERLAPDPGWRQRVRQWDERQEQARRARAAVAGPPPAQDPPLRKVFQVFLASGPFDDPASYAAVTADRAAVGRRCQVYVDRADRAAPGIGATAEDVVRTFDGAVAPRADALFGTAADVDHDGRFTVLLSGRLGKLSGGRVSLGGFVRGSDFFADLPAPFGNRCDMLYLNSDLRPGPYLHTLLAHEYTHAVVFSEHVFGRYLPELPGLDEEGWLNEGLAHMAEDLSGYSWENLDYRVSAFLNAPERYPLVVPDYYGAGLWRAHGPRGATYLFLRSCTEAGGTGFLGRLTRSSLQGVDNVEAATGRPFAELFRRWSTGLALAGLGAAGKDAPAALQRLDLHGTLGARLLCGPHYTELPLSGAAAELRVAGTAAAFILFHSPAGPGARVVVDAAPAAGLQVSLIRLPARTARLSLRHEVVAGGGLRLTVTAHDAGVTLTDCCWERMVPTARSAADTSYRPGPRPADTVRAWFGDAGLRAGQCRTSAVLPWPPPPDAEAFVLKVRATDEGGHHVAAWDVVPGRHGCACTTEVSAGGVRVVRGGITGGAESCAGVGAAAAPTCGDVSGTAVGHGFHTVGK